MRFLGVFLCGLLLMSCMTEEEKQIERIKEGEDRASAQKRNAMRLELLRTELVVNNGLTVELARALSDSVLFRLALSEKAVTMWRETAKELGRPPLLAWATVSAEVSLPGTEPMTYQIRLSGFGNMGPNNPKTRVTLPKRPARASGDSPLLLLPEGTDLQCSVLAVRVK